MLVKPIVAFLSLLFVSHNLVQGQILSVCPNRGTNSVDFDAENPHSDPSLCGSTITGKVTLDGHLDCGSGSGTTVDAGGVLDCDGYTVKAGGFFALGILVVQNGGKVENCRLLEGAGNLQSGIFIGDGDNKVTNCLFDSNVGGSISFGFFVDGNGNSVLKCCKAQGVSEGFVIDTQPGGQTTVANSIAEDCGGVGFRLGNPGGVKILKGIEVNGSGFRAMVIGRNNNLKRIKITHAGNDEAIDILGSNNKITNLDIQVSGGVDGIRFNSTAAPTNNVLKKMKIDAQDGGKCIDLDGIDFNEAVCEYSGLSCTQTSCSA